MTTKIGSGTSINLSIPLDKPITEYVNFFVALNTNQSEPVRFSYVEKVGFNKLEIGETDNELIGLLTSDQTAKMKGCLYMTLKAIDEVGASEDIGTSIPVFTTIEFIDNPLKSTK